MRLTLLGTSSMMPTYHRNHSGHFLEYDGTGILFDCGEGTQRQMIRAGLNIMRTKIICISHWHGDHVSGLLGLLQSVCREMKAEDPPLLIIGPTGSQEYMSHLMQSLVFESGFKVQVKEMPADRLSTAHETAQFTLACTGLDHGIPTLAFRFEERTQRNIDKAFIEQAGIPQGPHLQALKAGQDMEWQGQTIRAADATYLKHPRSFVYIADTRPCQAALQLAQGADLLLCEATHLHEYAAKAWETHHMTALQAGQLAAEAQARHLVLTHFSMRYALTDAHEAEAASVFPRTTAGQDLMQFVILPQ